MRCAKPSPVATKAGARGSSALARQRQHRAHPCRRASPAGRAAHIRQRRRAAAERGPTGRQGGARVSRTAQAALCSPATHLEVVADEDAHERDGGHDGGERVREDADVDNERGAGVGHVVHDVVRPQLRHGPRAENAQRDVDYGADGWEAGASAPGTKGCPQAVGHAKGARWHLPVEDQTTRFTGTSGRFSLAHDGTAVTKQKEKMHTLRSWTRLSPMGALSRCWEGQATGEATQASTLHALAPCPGAGKSMPRICRGRTKRRTW